MVTWVSLVVKKNRIMKKINKQLIKFLFAGICLLNLGGLFAQDDQSPVANEPDTTYQIPETIFYVRSTARSYGDSIVLRWAPENAGVWISANYYGWNIIRDKDEDDIKETDTIFKMQLNDNPIRPLTLEQMMQRYDSTNLFVGAAAQALYGESYYNPQEGDGLVNYVFRREQEQTQRQMMAYMAAESSRDAADALGLRFVDRNVKNGHSYTYRIECLIPEEDAIVPINIVEVDCTPYERQYDERISKVKIYQASPYTAFIYCEKNKLSGYYFERSTDNGKHWTALNTSPVYGYKPTKDEYDVYGEDLARLMEGNVGILDSLSLNISYKYRVRAFDAFADFAPEVESETFQMEDFIAPTVPVLEEIVPEDNKTCTLNWTMDKQDDDLKGFVIAFSDDPSGPWEKVTDLLPINTREWVDNNAHDRGRGFYRVFALDNNNNYSFSLSQINNIEDDVAPSAPTGVTAIVDTAGVLYMQWNENPEKDVLGYRVYFANQLDHDFIQRTGRRIENDTTFVDTLNRRTLTRRIYFYVVAEDNSHNFSAPSDTLAVPVPDIVPPGVAVLKDHTQTDESVTFTWLQSTSEDVAFYYVYRKKDNEQQWKCIKIIKPEELEPKAHIVFMDYPEPSAQNYNYCIEVIDESRLSSGKTGHTTVRFRGSAFVEVPMTLKASLTKTKAVKLDFTYDYPSKNKYYGVVFKSVNDEPAYAFTSFQRGENSCMDYKVEQGQKVTYYIQMFLGKGKRSKPSKSVTLTVK